MFTLTIAETKPGSEPVERLKVCLDSIDPAKINEVFLLLNQPVRKTRKDKGTHKPNSVTKNLL